MLRILMQRASISDEEPRIIEDPRMIEELRIVEEPKKSGKRRILEQPRPVEEPMLTNEVNPIARATYQDECLRMLARSKSLLEICGSSDGSRNFQSPSSMLSKLPLGPSLMGAAGGLGAAPLGIGHPPLGPPLPPVSLFGTMTGRPPHMLQPPTPAGCGPLRRRLNEKSSMLTPGESRPSFLIIYSYMKCNVKELSL